MTPKEKTAAAIAAICSTHGTSFSEVKSRNRCPHIVKARFQVASYLRENRKMSLPRIGEILRRNHATVFNMLKRSEENAQAVE